MAWGMPVSVQSSRCILFFSSSSITSPLHSSCLPPGVRTTVFCVCIAGRHRIEWNGTPPRNRTLLSLLHVSCEAVELPMLVCLFVSLRGAKLLRVCSMSFKIYTERVCIIEVCWHSLAEAECLKHWDGSFRTSAPRRLTSHCASRGTPWHFHLSTGRASRMAFAVTTWQHDRPLLLPGHLMIMASGERYIHV